MRRVLSLPCTTNRASSGWPVDNTRYFAPLTPIRVSPIGADFFSARGLETLWSEFAWVWLPCAIFALSGWWLRQSPVA